MRTILTCRRKLRCPRCGTVYKGFMAERSGTQYCTRCGYLFKWSVNNNDKTTYF